MGKTVELPIEIENMNSVTECWTANKLAIIKTSPYYRDWIASHYNLYVDTEEWYFLYGDKSRYSPSYHEEILERSPLRLFELNKENVIDFLKDKLKNQSYIIWYLKPYKELECFHEVLFYGYDDDLECFLNVGIRERGFQKFTIDYSYIIETIDEIKLYFLNGKSFSMHLSRYFQYPLTELKLNRNFNSRNCVFEAFEKIRSELKCSVLTSEKSDVFSKSRKYRQYNIYTGLNCLYAFKLVLQNEIEGFEYKPSSQGVISAAKKLYDHRRMMIHSMKYVMEKWDIAITRSARNSVNKYIQNLENVERWLNLCLKYERTQDKQILWKIILEIPSQYKNEKASLERFISKGINWNVFNENFI